MSSSFRILLVEDNLGDIRLIQEALKGGDSAVTLDVVQDGESAVNFLFKNNGYESVHLPNLILLDINIPKKDGLEVLSKIKSNPALKPIPVVIFSSSEAQRDIKESYNLQANCYIVKPFDFNKFNTVIKSIRDFWMNVVKLPQVHG